MDYEIPYVGRFRTHRARASEALKAWKVPTVAIASAIVVSLVLTVAWPVLLQRFRVNPNAQEMESTYIQRNIDATRAAYGLDKVKAEQYKATTEGEEGALADSAESTAQIRLLDPQIISRRSNSCSSPSSTTRSPTPSRSTNTTSTASARTR